MLWVSPAVFGVYLIHEQADLSERWYSMVNSLTGKVGADWSFAAGAAEAGTGRFLGILFLQVVIVFVVCVCIDKIRGALFSLVEGWIFKRRRNGLYKRRAQEGRE